MFERYTERARRVLFFARYEASRLGRPSIESEHLLLGLLHEGDGRAHQILCGAALTLDHARAEISRAVAAEAKIAAHEPMPLSPGGKAVLQRAASESTALNASHIGTEHLLLGLLHETEGTTARLFAGAGLRLDVVRACIVAATGAATSPEPHVVLVQVTIRPEMQEEFEAALLHNARESVRCDRGCLRFDVSQDKDQPARWVLYEVYDSPEAHAAHRQSPHFLAYDAVASRAVLEKSVSKCAGRHVTQ